MADRLAQQQKLWELCERFLLEHRVFYAEATINDNVYEDAPVLVGEIADIVGYPKRPDDEE